MIRNLSTDNKVTIFIVLLLLVDQIVKFIVKLNMALYESIPVFGHWFQIDFVENPGAAFGMQLGGEWGKLLLSLIRIAAIVLIAWYTHRLIHRSAPKGVIVGFALILAGAIGNMIDSAFYGLIFSESTPHAVATLFPEGGGYTSFLHGKVVDMLYFPIIESTWPDWMPWVGGRDFIFFSPVFNIADSYITVAVLYLIFFKHKYFMN
ncbi:MAG TPA: lipoprotein signal peptidase [Candidatus Tidjanibacter faecipullorum]|uniref:Lipoprotein signal peptidase n=1 Tax=Candidatus Tidjanibacter faecipullorum TaxID=2838766 RepID=A0A9D2ILV2_9BACT|nr:lipoprotein signal peptidase [Candidatus Tidjanibacter faecipullorum]